MLRDLGVETSGVVYADSSAALAIAKRKDASKLRHINVSSLWVQECQDRKDLEYRKVLGTENPADMMTKHLLREPLDKCMQELNQWRMSGRARSGLDIQGSGKAPAGEVKIGALQPSLGGFGSAPLWTNHKKLKRSGLSPTFWSTDRHVRFQPAVIIAIENWKKETSAMNYRSEGRIPLSDHLRAFVG